MTGYHDEIVDKSRERLRDLSAELKALDERRAEVRHQQSQVMAVLKALGMDERIPIAEQRAIATSSDDHGLSLSVVVHGNTRLVDPAWVERVKSWSHVFRTGEVMALVSPRSSATGTAVIAYLLQQGIIERQGRGRYRVVRRTPAPLPPIKDDTVPGPELRLVDGVVTTEPRPDRGYGSK